MRHLAAPGARRLGRQAAALAVVAGVVVLQSLAPAAARVRPAAAPAHVTAGTAGSAATVTGPHMYNPATGKPFPDASTVTVSQTTNLVNQMVTVQWTNFTPSLEGKKPAPNFNPSSTAYPVVVAECKGDSPGTSPADLAKCYGAANPGLTTPAPPFGQTTEVYATTSPKGTGTTSIQIQTSVQNQQLGCDSKHDCSLIILSAQGGVAGTGPQSTGADCSNHKFDQFTGVVSPHYATADVAFQVPGGVTGSVFCSWPNRIVIPLHFAKTVANCGFSQSDFSVEGSPIMQRAMTSWQSGLCNLSSPVSVGYNGSVSEPQARADFQQGTADVALTTQPASGSAAHPFTYAPVGISAAAVAYWLDNTKTGLPYPSGLKLTPLLLLKSLTQSYTYSLACGKGGGQPNPPLECDPGVVGNQTNLLTDPQFTALNRGLSTPDNSSTPMMPTVESDNNDMTWQTTSWIAANKDAASFLSGQKLADGEHLNTFYKGMQYPAQAFQVSDTKGWAFFAYQPVTPASQVTTDQVQNSSPSFDPTNPILDTKGKPTGGYNHVPAQQQGSRTLMAILGEPDAAAFLMPTFALQNPAGKYVTPTTASMAAAVKDMTVSRNGIIREDNPAAKDPAAYPLTMISYAMVPTGGISKQKAAKIAAWLDFIANHGQAQGTSLGQLPPGYLPLPASMRQQTLKAANEVLHQTGDPGTGGGGTGGGGGGTGGGGLGAGSGSSAAGSGSSGTGSSGSGSGTGTGSPTHTSSATKANAAYSSPGSTGMGRFLPILLIIGALLALGGSSAVVFGRPGSRAAVIAGWHRVERFTLRRGR
jgi:hypothetical protein